MVITTFAVRKDTSKWMFVLLLTVRYVEVDVRFTPDGKIRPLAINYDKTRTYGIDRVLAVRHGTSRLGGKGHCFTCLICGQKRNLWLEQGKWFVEAYCSVPESRAS